jgi:hypothetical protein
MTSAEAGPINAVLYDNQECLAPDPMKQDTLIILCL